MISTLHVIVCVLLTSKVGAAKGNGPTPSVCEVGWKPFQDEKCIQLFPNQITQFDTATHFCSSKGSSLLSIKSADEQTYVFNFVYSTNEIENSIWLGTAEINGTLGWWDGSPLHYSNWDSTFSSRKPASPSQCAELTINGKWSLVGCTRRNMVVCEKQQVWSLAELQASFLRFRKTQVLNPVPKGFIYVQLGGQPDPRILWPTVTWEQVTRHYAGLFFRAEGKDSASFGTTQAENSPRLTSALSTIYKASPELFSVSIVNGGTSKALFTGDDVGGVQKGLHTKFTHSGGEVRPRNQAIRIWKRT